MGITPMEREVHYATLRMAAAMERQADVAELAYLEHELFLADNAKKFGVKNTETESARPTYEARVTQLRKKLWLRT